MNPAEFKTAVEKIVHQVYPDAEVLAPLPCWDSSSLVGITIKAPKMMGKEDCVQIVSFALSPVEANDLGTVQRRTLLAMQTMRYNIVSTFKRKKAEEAEANAA